MVGGCEPPELPIDLEDRAAVRAVARRVYGNVRAGISRQYVKHPPEMDLTAGEGVEGAHRCSRTRKSRTDE